MQTDENANTQPRVTQNTDMTVRIQPVTVTAGQSIGSFVTVPGMQFVSDDAETPVAINAYDQEQTAYGAASPVFELEPSVPQTYVLHAPCSELVSSSPDLGVEAEENADFSRHSVPYLSTDYQEHISYAEGKVEPPKSESKPDSLINDDYTVYMDGSTAEYDALMEEAELLSAYGEGGNDSATKPESVPSEDYAYSGSAISDSPPVTADIDYSTARTEPPTELESEMLADAERANAKKNNSQLRREEEREYLEYLKKFDTPLKKGGKKEKKSDDSSASVATLTADGTDLSVAAVEARFNYEIDRLGRRHRIDEYTFTTDGVKKSRSSREVARSADRRVKYMGKALRYEREASRSYYLAATDSYECDPERRLRYSAQIDSVVRRMELLLSERREIENELIKLYTGAIGASSAAEFKRGSKRAERAAKKMYKAQRPLAKRLDKLHAPLDLKERIYGMMNERTLAAADIEYSRAAMRQKGVSKAEKRSHAKNVSRQRKNIRYLEADVKHFMKKAERHNDKHAADNVHTAWLVFFLLLLVLGGAALYFVGKLWLGWW